LEESIESEEVFMVGDTTEWRERWINDEIESINKEIIRIV